MKPLNIKQLVFNSQTNDQEIHTSINQPNPTTSDTPMSALQTLAAKLKKNRFKTITIQSKQKPTPYILTISPLKIELTEITSNQKNVTSCNIDKMTLTYNNTPCTPDQFKRFINQFKQISNDIKLHKTIQYEELT